MAAATPRPSKRKHVDGDRETDAGGSGKKSKEERRAEKRAKREAASESPVRRKAKASGTGSQKLVGAPNNDVPAISGTEFKLMRARTNISVPPRFAGDSRRGVEEILDNLVMRYVPSLRGVLLSHKNLTFVQDIAVMYAEGPYPTTTVEFDAGVWAPEVGMRVTGRISLHATDHIGILVHRTFNASIDRLHIPGDGEWEFVHGPVANDPELGAESVQGDEESGRWIHTQTGEPLGGEFGLVEFTIIGYTIANQMLSLHGSLQPDPFAPEHYAVRQSTVQPIEPEESETETATAKNQALEGSEDEVEVMEEDLAAPRGKRRKVVDVIPVAPEPETAPIRRKKKKTTIEGEANVVVAEAAATVVEEEGQKKRKKKKDKINV